MGFTFFGLTGGIACGKSTVAGFMQEQGLAIVDADVVARQVVERGTEGLREIALSFGQSVVTADGDLDREALGELVFGNEEARLRLNGITHPRIRKEARAQAERWAKRGHEWVAYEAALLVEVGLASRYRPLVVVVCDEATQLRRLMARNGYSEQEARARIISQMPLSEKKKHADILIDTEGSLEEVRRKTAQGLLELKRWAGLGGSESGVGNGDEGTAR